MKITSASKKVLASALSAAMVVAFAPTVAFADADSDALAMGAVAKVAVASHICVDGEKAIKTPATYKYHGLAVNGNADEGYYFVDGTGEYVEINSANHQQAGTPLYEQETAPTYYKVGEVVPASPAKYVKKDALESGVAGEITLLTDIEVAGTDGAKNQPSVFKITGASTLNLNGHEVSYEGAGNGNTIDATADLKITGTGTVSNNKQNVSAVYAQGASTDLTVDENVTIKGSSEASKLGYGVYVDGVFTNSGTVSGGVYAARAGELVLKGGELGKTWAGKATLKGGKIAATGQGVDIIALDLNGGAGTATVSKNAEATVSATGSTVLTTGRTAGATAIKGAVELEDGAVLSAEAVTSSNDETAVAITGAVSETGNKGGTVKATAKALGAETSATGFAEAIAIGGAATAKNIEATAETVDNTYAIAVQGALNVKYANINAVSNDEDLAFANAGTLSGDYATPAAPRTVTSLGTAPTIKAGTVYGMIKANAAQNITGGTFSMEEKDLKPFVNTDSYVINDDGKATTVSFKKIANTTAGDADGSVRDSIAQFFEDLAFDGATKAFSYVGDMTAEKMAGILKDGNESGNITYKVNQKALTKGSRANSEAQDAFIAAVSEYAAGLNCAVDFYNDLSAQVLYATTADLKAGKIQEAVANVSELGQTTGRKPGDVTLTVASGMTEDYVKANGIVFVQYIDGKVTPVDYAVKNGKVSVKLHSLAPYASIKAAAGLINDQINKGETGTEKATQSISVAKKSMAVKLGAKKTKTAKGKAFNMGALAETDLTIAKVSGSSKITVKGNKVSLSKGAKRGTYKATVSLKAAATDAYMADATTITVKFVIK